MATGEFELIDHYFRPAPDELTPDGVVLGIGDDAALIQPPADRQLVVATDTLVADRHFPLAGEPELIGERAVRVNLSDLAAMGADPAWCTLCLTLPGDWSVDGRRQWTAAFSRGLKAANRAYGCTLVGGDTTSGPLAITLQMLGLVPPGRALRRDGACVDDFVLVTGSLGKGAAALHALQHSQQLDENARNAYYKPEVRVAEGRALRGIASSAQDISDGLLADLGHICAASDVAAELDLSLLPIADWVRASGGDQALTWATGGGDDYELVFTVAPDNMPMLAMAQARGELQATVIGRIVSGAGVHCELDGRAYRPEQTGYNHF